MATIEHALPALRGRLVKPSDADYDALRMVANAGVEARPALIAQVASAGDAAMVIRFARDAGLELAVRSGGHSAAGHGTVEGGVVIDLRPMKAIGIDRQARTAWAEAGLTAGEYTAAVGEHGLVTGFGDTGSVGISGLTLGGGVGYLSRRLGLTIDSLIGAELVTADGEVLRVDERNHPELFWAIRGGGGNFGVVTRLGFALHLVPQVYGGMLVLPASAATIARFIERAHEAPEELTTIANVMDCPPMPFVAPEHHGRPVIMAILCHAGDGPAGEASVAPFRALAEPLADQLGAMAYADLFPPPDPDYRPLAVGRNMFLERFTETDGAALLDRMAASAAPLKGAQLRVLGGAIERVPADATAYSFRAAPIMANLFSFYETATDRARGEAWVNELAAAIDQGYEGAYVNFVGDEGPAGARAAYSDDTWQRLRGVKARYDPDNVFRRNQNIPPAA